MGDIQSAVQWLGKLLKDEAEYLMKVEGKVRELQDELAWMQCFLRDADAGQLDSTMARRWVSQIREFAYDAEDTVEKFLVSVVVERGRVMNLAWVKNFLVICRKSCLVHQIGKDIDELKNKMSLLTSKLQTYKITLKLGGRSSSWLFREKPIFTSVVESETKMIGREKDLNDLVAKCSKSPLNSKGIVSILGVGGVGKTFVAKKIFDHGEIRKEFNAFAWAHISEPCQISAVQQDLLSSLTSKSKEQISQMTDFEMKDELYRVQWKHKCFIVLDGVWKKEIWENLKESFLSESRGYMSMLLITNRQKKVLECEDNMHQIVYHELKPLCEEDGLSLLNQIVKDPDDVPIDGKLLGYQMVKDPTHDLPVEDPNKNNKLEHWKREMLKHCEGLPLIISVLGGVLATKRTLQEWEEVHEYLSSSIDDQQTVYNKSKRWGRVLELSYYELPYQLKPCFLYLGYFLKNLLVPTKKIIQLWAAEGLVSSDDDEISEYTLEYISENCLGDLVQRSLVQVGSRGLTGKAKTCLVHDLVSELCKDKASKGNLLSIVPLGAVRKDKKSSHQSSKKSSKSSNKKIRRLAIYYTTSSAKLSLDIQSNKNIRSLLFFNTLSSNEVLIPVEPVLKEAFTEYRLLRVLDIENIEVKILPKKVGDLIHLRYLSIRGSWVSMLPSTIQNLRCLQTLDLRVILFVRLKVPDVLHKLDRLVHLYFPSQGFDLYKGNELQLKDLKDLETLSNFCNQCKAEDVENLSNLRRFTSCGFIEKPESIKPLLDSSSLKLEHIGHVALSLDGKILKKEREVLKSCSKLRKLWVKGEITGSLTLEMFPKNLIEVSFNNCKFESDPMEALGQLEHLRKLCLENAAYLGTTMNCSVGFQKLEYLFLRSLDNLVNWTIEGAALQKLSHLKIQSCQKLVMTSNDLKSINKSLKVVEISYMPLSFFGFNDVITNSQSIEESWFEDSGVADIRISHVLDRAEVVPVAMEMIEGTSC